MLVRIWPPIVRPLGFFEVGHVPDRATRQFGAFDDYGGLPLDHVSDRAAGIISAPTYNAQLIPLILRSRAV